MRARPDHSLKIARATAHSGSPAFTLVESLVIVGVIGILLTIAVPHYARHRAETQRQLCVKNLMVIDQAKEQWLLDHPGEASAELYEEDLAPYFQNTTLPTCPGGGVYNLGTVDQYPDCSLEKLGHVLDAGCGEVELAPEPGHKPKRNKGRKNR